MKTRLSAMAVAISSISMLTACGSGGPGGFTSDAPPTVTVTAPATATAGTAFLVTWESTAAGSCASTDLTGVSATSGSVPQTETAAATKTYSVTCTGAGGSTTATSAPVVVAAPPAVAGLWQGTNTAGVTRAISGVVTNEGAYWLAYAQPGNNGTIVGFYTGTGAPAITSTTGGTYASTDLREINFAGGFSGGNAAAGTLDSGIFTSKTSFSGVLSTVAGGAVTGVNFVNITSKGFVGNPPPASYTNDTGMGGSATLTTLDGPATLTIHNMSTVVAIDPANSSGASDSATIVSDEVLNGTVSAGVFTPTDDGSSYSLSLSCVPIQTATPPNQICAAPLGKYYFTVPAGVSGKGVGGSLSLTTGTTTLFSRRSATGTIMRKTTYTFLAPSSVVTSSLPGITAGTFDLSTYNPAYDTAPALATLTGTYTGSAGVGTTTTAATFVVGSDGAISGAAGSCSYTGNAVTHPTGGNVYDVTLTVSGGSCTSAGAFTGVSTYDATAHQVVVTTMNAARDKGLMFVGTKP